MDFIDILAIRKLTSKRTAVKLYTGTDDHTT